MAADGKSAKTPELINMLHEITLLHFKDLRRSFYGTGNYRLSGSFKIYFVSRDAGIHWAEVVKRKFSKIFSKIIIR